MGDAFKPLKFCGSSLADLRAFPSSARRESGYQLDKVQHGHDPSDWKAMKAVGSGAREIRIRETSGAFRIVYVAKFEGAVYVLHCFQKTSQATSKADIELARTRYRDVVETQNR